MFGTHRLHPVLVRHDDTHTLSGWIVFFELFCHRVYCFTIVIWDDPQGSNTAIACRITIITRTVDRVYMQLYDSRSSVNMILKLPSLMFSFYMSIRKSVNKPECIFHDFMVILLNNLHIAVLNVKHAKLSLQITHARTHIHIRNVFATEYFGIIHRPLCSNDVYTTQQNVQFSRDRHCMKGTSSMQCVL